MIYPVFEPLELRQEGNEIRGRFPYGQTATVADRGRVRKEMIAPGAFRFAIDDTSRELSLLRGHSFDAPLASRRAGTLRVTETDEAVDFVATLPAEADRPSWVTDTVASIRAGLSQGISPGFRLPPRSAVDRAPETFEPEPGGSPGVEIRVIRDAILVELSIVSRPSYTDSEVEIRSEDYDTIVNRNLRRRLVWL